MSLRIELPREQIIFFHEISSLGIKTFFVCV